jgi:3-oxoadipate enol-lactonase/4-carboxymuconolactone decarboxylase
LKTTPRLQRNGYALHYDVGGEGCPLLLLPGAAADGSVWLRAGFVSLLEDEFTCVLFDPPGIGLSEAPSDREASSVGAIADDVVALADELGFGRFALWGASAGGAVATVVAVEDPGRVAALVLSGAWPGDYEPAREWIENHARESRVSGARRMLENVYAEEGAELPEWAGDALDEDSEMVARILEGLLAYDWTGRAMPAQVTVPTLILVGEQEDLNREAEAAAAAMPNAEAVYLAGRGHVGVWPGAPNESVERVLRFLRQATADLQLTS